MSIQNVMWKWSLKAGEDLNDLTAGTGHLYKAVRSVDGKLANDGKTAIGILQYGAETGGDISFSFAGVMKYTAGAAVTSGDTQLTITTSGYGVTADSGSWIVGKALANTTSGSVGYGLFNFANPVYMESSSAYQATYETFEVSAKSDLSGAAGLVVDASAGTVAATSPVATGVLITGTTSGGTSIARAMGIVPAIAGDAVTIDQSLAVTTGGYMITGNSGDVLVGRALATATSGSALTAAVNFGTPNYATSCLDVMY